MALLSSLLRRAYGAGREVEASGLWPRAVIHRQVNNDVRICRIQLNLCQQQTLLSEQPYHAATLFSQMVNWTQALPLDPGKTTGTVCRFFRPTNLLSSSAAVSLTSRLLDSRSEGVLLKDERASTSLRTGQARGLPKDFSLVASSDQCLRSSSSWASTRVSSPSSVLVVQPRLKPEWLLKSRLSEALHLVEALHTRGRKSLLHQPTPGPLGPASHPDWWPSGVPDTSPWVVAGHAERRSSTSRHSPASFFGKGAVETVAAHVLAADTSATPTEAVFVNAALSGTQQRILEQAWGKKVIDRVHLIIDIFGAHAATKEAKLQVELASLAYQRSRLVRVRASEARGRGGFGPQESLEVVSARAKGSGGRGFLAGAGESELQLQRTRLSQKQHRLRRMLEHVRRTRELHRAGRRRSSAAWGGKGVGLPLVAVVGYTNAGKSTLVSALSGTSHFCDDTLFATLDPRIRAVKLPSGRKALLSDTVGFISDLPIQLVEAFQATLEEVVEADLLLHVIDGSAADGPAQRAAVLHVLQHLGVQTSVEESGGGPGGLHLPIIEAWNKADLWQDSGSFSSDEGQAEHFKWEGQPSWEAVAAHHSTHQARELKFESVGAETSHARLEEVVRVDISGRTGQGLDQLLERIDEALWRRGF